MKNIASTILLIIPLSGYCFDYSSYEESTLDDIFSRSNIILDLHKGDEGIEIITPTVRVALKEQIVKLPYDCPNGALMKFMSMVGFNTKEFPPINFCIDIQSKSGTAATFHVQDSLVGFINSEVKVGDFVNVWALWVYSNGYTGLPVFLINSYEAA